MGRLDESVLSTASTLIDSCSVSLDEHLDKKPIRHAGGAKENNGVNSKSIMGWKQSNLKNAKSGKNTSAATYSNAAAMIEDRNPNIISPFGSQFAISTNRLLLLSTDHSVGGSTTCTETSKLDLLRAKTRLLRKQGSQKIAESRESLRKRRTVSIESPPRAYRSAGSQEELPAPSPKPRRTAAASIMKGTMVKRRVDLPVLLRRSNNVIDQLTSEIATAGNIINESSSHEVDMTIRLDTTALISDEVITLPPPIVEPFDDQESIENDDTSLHNLSVDDDWDHSTISASAPYTPSIYDPLTYSNDNVTPPPSQSVNCSGLPPPEVVVKITAPRSPKPRTAAETRHLRQRPPSLSPHRGDCVSMYNANQKCEKLAIENDCLRRQLDLLESRHRDWETKLTKHMTDSHEQVPEVMRTPGSPTISTTSMSKAVSYRSYRNRRRKKNDRRRLAMALLVAPFVLSWTLWFYRTVRDVAIARRMNRHGFINNGPQSNPSFVPRNQHGPKATLSKPALNGLGTLMREGVLRQTVLGPMLFRDKRNGRVQTEATSFESFLDGMEGILDYTDALPVPAAPKPRRIQGATMRESKNSTRVGGKGSRFKPWLAKRLSKMNVQKGNDPTGAWLKRSRRIKTRELHAEL